VAPLQQGWLGFRAREVRFYGNLFGEAFQEESTGRKLKVGNNVFVQFNVAAGDGDSVCDVWELHGREDTGDSGSSREGAGFAKAR